MARLQDKVVVITGASSGFGRGIAGVGRDRRLCRHRPLMPPILIHISGLHHAACLLAPFSFVRPLLGWHVEFATDLLTRRSAGGT
jgi:hypothetical protein